MARLGGDEFVLPIRPATIQESRHGVDRVLRSVARPYKLGISIGSGIGIGICVITITASSGATTFPINHADADTLLRHADHAIYAAKQSGRNGKLF